MQALEKNLKVFEKAGTVAVGLSVDSVPCKAAWAKSLKIKKTQLLADFWPHGKVASSLGLFRKEGILGAGEHPHRRKRQGCLDQGLSRSGNCPNIREVLAALKK